jgi:phytoene desaturase
MKSIAIIGAGVAGLAAASYLARKGFHVTVFEKNNFPGGRCASITKEGHRFDIGATLLMMPEVYERMFRDFGKEMHEVLDLVRMEPVYRLKFPDGVTLDFSSDLRLMQEQLEAAEAGSYLPFLDYMAKSMRAYRVSMKHIIDRNYKNIFQFINPVNLIRLARLNAFGNHYRVAAKYFQNENLRTAFTFQNIYVGQNPFRAPAIFSMLPFMELSDGVYFPKGGMNKIAEALEQMALENGVEIRYRSVVTGIRVTDERVAGIELSDTSFFASDIVLANADLPYVYNELLPDVHEASRVNKLGYTCSALVFHWGMDSILPGLEQHNIYVSNDYRQNIEAVFSGTGIALEPSFYIHSPARADASAAPDGKDSISVIVPVGHLSQAKNVDWDSVRNQARESVFKRLSKEGLPDFQKHILFEKVYNPVTWENLFNLSRGATFGSLNHNLMQMGYFRPHNQHKKYKNLFFAGGSTHPGNGVPMTLISARLTSEKIVKHYQ